MDGGAPPLVESEQYAIGKHYAISRPDATRMQCFAGADRRQRMRIGHRWPVPDPHP